MTRSPRWPGGVARPTRIKLGTSIVQMSGRTPTSIAMHVLTLDHLSNGRVILGMGVSGPQVVEGWYGQPFGKPLARTREVVEIIRKVLAREDKVTNDGPHYPLPLTGENATGLGKPLKPIVHPLRADVPIWLGAEGPKNVAQTAEIADGWIPIFYTPKSRGHVPAVARRGLRPAGRAAYPRRLRDRRDLPPPGGVSAEEKAPVVDAIKPVRLALHGRHGRQGGRTSTTRSSCGWATRTWPTRCRSST